MEPEMKDELWICAGERLLTGGKLGVMLVPEATPAGPPIFFDLKALKHGRPGMIYSIPTTRTPEGVRCRLAEAKYMGRWDNTPQAAQWSAEAMADRATHDRNRRRAKDAGEDPLAKSLLPATQAYHSAHGLARQEVLARIVEIVVSGRLL